MDWMPMDTAPKDRLILATYPGNNMPIPVRWWGECWMFSLKAHSQDDRTYFKFEFSDEGAFTHWMPLPESPK